MTGTERYRPPLEVELPFAPSMQPMARGQSFLIEEFGAEATVGTPLDINLEGGRHVFKGALPSVRVIIGEGDKCDYLEVVDISATHWYDERTKRAGNFALFRWSEVQEDHMDVVSVDAMLPGKLFAVGQTNNFGKNARHPLPPTVRADHVTLGIRRNLETMEEHLLIRNHNHDGHTEVWNLKFGTNVQRPALVEGQLTHDQKQAAWHIGSTGAAKSIEKPKH